MTAEIRNDIIATEHINAPPGIVFTYFTDPTLITTWIGDHAELDPQPGGMFSLDMGQVAALGTCLSIDPPHRVVFTWGIPGNATLPPGGSTVQIVLTPDGENTMVVLTHRGLTTTQLDTHRTGWQHQLGSRVFNSLYISDRPWYPNWTTESVAGVDLRRDGAA